MTTKQKINSQVYMLLRRANNCALQIVKAPQIKREYDREINVAQMFGMMLGYANSAEELAHTFGIKLETELENVVASDGEFMVYVKSDSTLLKVFQVKEDSKK